MSVEDLLQIARHGRGDNVYLIRFHYLPPGGWAQPNRVYGNAAETDQLGHARAAMPRRRRRCGGGR
jgi:hypothetical protein